MFLNTISDLSKPTKNTYPDDRVKFSGNNFLTENSSGFENILKEMGDSQNQLSKSKGIRCDNPNCKSIFSVLEKCNSCNKTYCKECLTACENCNQQTCKFCVTIQYNKTQDIIKCPIC
jgi:hypothetical protein